jgi:hypothetical protein
MDEQASIEILRTAIHDVLNPDDLYEEKQRESFERFLNSLRISQTEADDFDRVIAGAHFGDGGAYDSATVGLNPAQLYAVLSEAEKKLLKEHYLETLDSLKLRFPALVNEFPEQFPKRKTATQS